jgi:hypothetical protein
MSLLYLFLFSRLLYIPTINNIYHPLPQRLKPITDTISPRQRNTAASARFRAKKKRREQSLERGAREKREQLEQLEGRIRELEVENGWLRDLIMETTGTKGKGKEKENEKEKDGDGYNEDEAEGIVVQERERRGRERKDGVGTRG